MSALDTAVRAWLRLVEQLAPYAKPNDDPAELLARILSERPPPPPGSTEFPPEAVDEYPMCPPFRGTAPNGS